MRLGTYFPFGDSVPGAGLGKVVDKFHSLRNILAAVSNFFYQMAAYSLQTGENAALPKNFHIDFLKVMHPDVFGGKLNGFIIFFFRNGRH